ncbi:hypothetical protein RND81_13G089400 [Saponaria officinalis]|uniref:GRF-type domain-containing protein n=1 Tax=Saponaria officinalis TaxID=3572 RepID=A0AAW1GZ65_SAPOF
MSSNSSNSTNNSFTFRVCKCGIPVATKTSWTTQNPGRRFVTCKFYNPDSMMSGCNFFRWIDDDMTNWQRHVINRLVMENKCLKNEVRRQDRGIDENSSDHEAMEVYVEKLENKCNMLTNEVEVLKSEKKKVKLVLGCVIFLLFIVYGKLGM